MTKAAVPSNVPPPTYAETSADTEGKDIAKGWVDEIREEQDEILRDHGGGDLKLYERLMRDDQVYSTFRQRRDAVVAREVMVDPGGDSPLDLEAADFIRSQITRCGFDRVTHKMLTGIMYGRGIAECMFAHEDGLVVMPEIKVRRAGRFRFTNGGELRMMVDNEPVKMPERKFWTFICGTDHDDDPNGRGLGSFLYWPVWFKRNAYRFWVTFLEIFSQPTPIGTHPASWQKKQQEEFLAKLDSIRVGGKLAVPAGVKVELATATRDSGGDYKTFVELLNASIAKVVLTQTMTTDDGSSLAQAKVHLKVADIGAKSDSDLLTETFSNGPVKWLVEWNFPGAKPPIVYRDFTEAADLSDAATRDHALSQIGYRPTPERILATYGDGYEPFTPPASPTTPMNFSEQQSASDAIEDLMAGGEWRRVLGPEVARVEELVADAATLEEVRERINELALAHPKELTASLAQLMFAARAGANGGYEADDFEGQA